MIDAESNVIAPVVTDNSKIDTMEVDTNIEATSENGAVEDKGASPEQSKSKSEPPSNEEQEQRAKKTRNEKKRAEKERLIAELATEREKNRQLEQSKPPVKQEPKVDLSKEPDITQYTDPFLYAQHLARFEANQGLKERDEKVAQQQKQQHIDSFNEQINEVRAEMPEFDDRVQQLYDAGLIPPAVEDAVLKSSISGKIAQHFIKHTGDLEILNKLRPELIPQAIRNIENFIKSGGQEVKAAPRVTQATAPIKPPGNTARTDRSINSFTQEEIENMPLSEFKKLTNM